MISEVPTSYKLELPTGRFPEFPDRAKVFFMPRPTLGLLSDQVAKEIAAKYNFNNPPEQISSTVYRWSSLEPLVSTFELNILSHNFQFHTDFMSRPELLLETNLPDGFDAAQRTKSFLSRANLLPSDVATSSGLVTLKKSVGGELIDAVSVSDADFITVDIMRTPIDSLYPMYSPEGTIGTVHAVLTGGIGDFNGVVQFDFRHQEVDYTQMHTYPLRPASEAWSDLQVGKGYIAELGSSTTQATIRSVELGYYDDFVHQEYLQPIYVFKGDEFIGYASALDQEWVEPSN